FNRRIGRAGTASLAAMAIVAAACLGLCDPADAQRPAAAPRTTADDARAIQATAKVTFGYVLSGDGATDETSRQGLIGLGKFLVERTAVEPGEPFAVNILNDEIAFFPILYWPVLASARPLPEATLTKIDAYMKQGGMIIFDTKDYGQGVPSGFSLRNEGGTPLQRLLGTLDIPRLEPVPEHHVLTKSFYLLRSFPGRWDGGQLWVEAEAPRDSDQGRQARRVDGVSSILITSNDFAAAWARDDRGQYLYPTVPGGERQREMALRTGVNIVMYALTGNYKADQVHVPALLARLGQLRARGRRCTPAYAVGWKAPSALPPNRALGRRPLAGPLAATQHPGASSRSTAAMNPWRPGLEQLVDRLLADGTVGAVLGRRGVGRGACGAAAPAQEPRRAAAGLVPPGGVAGACQSHAAPRGAREPCQHRHRGGGRELEPIDRWETRTDGGHPARARKQACGHRQPAGALGHLIAAQR